MGDTSTTRVAGRASVSSFLQCGNQVMKCVLGKVLCVCPLHHSLPSVVMLVHRETEGTFKHNRASILSNKVLCATEFLNGSLYTLVTTALPPVILEAALIAATDIWHARTGFAHHDAILQRAEKNVFNGLTLSKTPVTKQYEPCT